MFANIAHHKSWRDQHSGKSSPDSYRYSSSLGSQVALDTPSSEPVTPVEAPLLVLPKRRGQNAKSSAKPHIRNKSREERSSTSIDLSRSSIELEGLGIYTNLERDTRFHQSVSNLHRSISQVSSSPSITRLGQTYVHPRRQLPTAASTPQNIGQRHSVDERYFTSVNRSLTAIGSTALSIPDDDSAATDDDNNHAANSPEEAETPVTASIDFRHSSPIILQRAHTDTAISSKISSSWTPSEQLSSTAELASHAAAVRAARIAFAKKEATKARKIEEQQKKAQQRDERRHQRSVSHMIKSPPATTADKKLSELQQQQQQHHHHRRAISEAFPPRSSFTENDIAEENFNLEEGVTTTATTTTNTTTPIHLGPPKLPAATKHNWNKFLTWGKRATIKPREKSPFLYRQRRLTGEMKNLLTFGRFLTWSKM